MAVTFQSHFHLSSTLSDITTPVATSEWKAVEREEIPLAFVSLKRTVTSKGKLYAASSGGSPVQLKNWRYRVFIRAEASETVTQRTARMSALQGKVLYLHDNYHDASAHGSGYKTVTITNMGGFSSLFSSSEIFTIDIELEEINA